MNKYLYILEKTKLFSYSCFNLNINGFKTPTNLFFNLYKNFDINATTFIENMSGDEIYYASQINYCKFVTEKRTIASIRLNSNTSES